MHFCVICNNMYYIRITDESDKNTSGFKKTDQLIYYCNNCKHTDMNQNVTNTSVLRTQLHKNKEKYTNIIHEFTKYDPTLPRTNRILCPNLECLTNGEDERERIAREIITIRYDDINMKYVYLCTTCDTSWKPDEKK